MALEYLPEAVTLHKLIKKGLTEIEVWNLFAQLMQGVKDIHGSERLFAEKSYVG